MQLKDMKRTPRKRDTEVAATPRADYYPLTLYLNREEIRKLFGDGEPDVGQTYGLVAECEVTTYSKTKGERDSESATLTIKRAAIETPKKGDGERGKALYGSLA